MLNRRVLYLPAALIIGSIAALCQTNTAQQNAAQQPTTTQYYKLSFVLREIDEGKTLNQRAFTMTVASDGTWYSLRAGTRVPITTGNENTTNYTDVGVNLDVRTLEGDATAVPLTVKADISSAALDGSVRTPPIRQIQVRTAALVPLGKPTTVFIADDPSSKHRFELEVNPSREK